MAIRASRIAWVGMAVIAVVVLWLWWNARERPAPIDPNDAPWIGLPKSGMDATEQNTRMLMSRAFEYGRESSYSDSGSLAFECGEQHWRQSFDGKERYIARIGEGAWGPAWKVILDVHGDRIDVAWTEADSVIPPPPPPPAYRGKGKIPDLTLVTRVAHTSKSRAELEPIRALWNDQALWHAPQDSSVFGCFDGDPIFLEACIDGRYAARFHNCDPPTLNTTSKLWQAFNDLLPPPPKPEWRDATGNPVPGPSNH
jgi:hypothetical protein